jgi:hypothetical protein
MVRRKAMRPPPDAVESAALSGRELVLFETVRDFFNEPSNLDTLKAVLLRKSVSLRRLESIATSTTTAKEANTSESYYSWLRAYGKKLFDPFARSKHISFQSIETTVGQLNFMRWAMTQPDLMDTAAIERRQRIKRKAARASEHRGNVISFAAHVQVSL